MISTSDRNRRVSFGDSANTIHVVENYKLSLDTPSQHGRVWYGLAEMHKFYEDNCVYKEKRAIAAAYKAACRPRCGSSPLSSKSPSMTPSKPRKSSSRSISSPLSSKSPSITPSKPRKSSSRSISSPLSSKSPSITPSKPRKSSSRSISFPLPLTAPSRTPSKSRTSPPRCKSLPSSSKAPSRTPSKSRTIPRRRKSLPSSSKAPIAALSPSRTTPRRRKSLPSSSKAPIAALSPSRTTPRRRKSLPSSSKLNSRTPSKQPKSTPVLNSPSRKELYQRQTQAIQNPQLASSTRYSSFLAQNQQQQQQREANKIARSASKALAAKRLHTRPNSESRYRRHTRQPEIGRVRALLFSG